MQLMPLRFDVSRNGDRWRWEAAFSAWRKLGELSAISIRMTIHLGYSIVVPVYRSAKILPDLVARIEPVMGSIGMPFELILVSDGSPDDSWAVISQLAETRPWLKGIRLMRNYGQHNALLAGIRAARFDTTITMDDDLQHAPEQLPKLLAEYAKGFDVVYAAPEQEQHGLFRDLASVITKAALSSAMGGRTARMVSAWRVFRTELRGAFESYQSPYVSLDVMLTWATTSFSGIRVPHAKRVKGQSGYNFRKLARHGMNMMTGFTTLPLRIASAVGFAFTLFGFGVLAYVLVRYVLEGGSVPGFPFLASMIAIFSGAQLFALGVMGEYLARMHFRIMGRPCYAVRETIAEKANWQDASSTG